MQLLVEGFGPDAIALARHLSAGDDEVILAGRGDAPQSALDLRRRGVVVVPHADLDARPGAPDVAYLDVWTPEIAPRVVGWRAAGTRLSCLSDLLLEHVGSRAVGVTGSAGKSTTTAFTIQLLRAAGITTHASTSARSGNLWATAELVPLLESETTTGSLLLELTSSHLAFCASSPHVAIVTAFWPDHVELHGSVAAYRRAKEAIVLRQRRDDHVVVIADDPAVASFAELTPACIWSVSRRGPVGHGVGVVDDTVTAFTEGDATSLGTVATPGPRTDAILLAVAGALAAGAPPAALVGALDRLEQPPHRGTIVGRRNGTLLVDDSMAATPSKGAATLAAYPDHSVVVVVGGELESVGRRVHSSPEETALLGEACAAIRRAARAIVAFGPAGAALAGRVRAEAVVATIDEAIAAAIASSDGATAVVVSPMYPVAPADRARIPGLLDP